MGSARCFVHPDGRRYLLEVIDCRVRESWGGTGKRGGGNTSTRDDDADAVAFATAKVKKLLKEGYVEGAPEPGLAIDREADVLATFRTDVDGEGDTRYPFAPIVGRPHFHAFTNISVAEWIMLSEDGRRGVVLRTFAKNAASAMVEPLLDALAARRTEIFADEATPLRAFPVELGRFTRLVVLSPTAENVSISRNVSFENPVLSRSVFGAFPAFDSEITGTESVGMAEARTNGRASINTSRWDRDPHPVLDLAYLKKPTEKPKFLAHDPTELERRLGAKAIAGMREVEIQARNYAGEVRRFVRGEPPPDLAELRAFFGYER